MSPRSRATSSRTPILTFAAAVLHAAIPRAAARSQPMPSGTRSGRRSQDALPSCTARPRALLYTYRAATETLIIVRAVVDGVLRP